MINLRIFPLRRDQPGTKSSAIKGVIKIIGSSREMHDNGPLMLINRAQTEGSEA